MLEWTYFASLKEVPSDYVFMKDSDDIFFFFLFLSSFLMKVVRNWLLKVISMDEKRNGDSYFRLLLIKKQNKTKHLHGIDLSGVSMDNKIIAYLIYGAST